MARYIDAETALKIIDNYAKTVTADGIVVVKAIRDIVEIITPTADVVPKSEVEELIKKQIDLHEEWSGLKQAKRELASEIFAEIDNIINDYKLSERNLRLMQHGEPSIDQRYAELKKKYTEGEE